jgi:hypothetical protein
VSLERLRKLWPKVASKVQRRDRTLEPLLRSTEPVGLDGVTVTIAFGYPFHCACLSGAEEKSALLEALREVAGRPLEANYVVVVPGSAVAAGLAPAPVVATAEAPAASDDVSIDADPFYRTAEELGGRVHLVE